MALNYVYQYKDHLGNVRLSYQDINNNGSVNSSEIKEENNYYPFGLEHKGYNNIVNGRDHKYGFGGKEEQSELGLDWIDITARNYDPALGRWMNIDLLAEKYDRHSPYAYVMNSPILFIDPDGMQVDLSAMFTSSENFQAGIQLLLDLGAQTGLSLYVTNEDKTLEYLKNENGPVLSALGLGSEKARDLVKGAIDSGKTIVSFDSNRGSSVSRSDRTKMNLNINDIEDSMDSVSQNLFNGTMGFGMTFMHELFHTEDNGHLEDYDVGSPLKKNHKGDVVNKMNEIRAQLDGNQNNVNFQEGKLYGQRTQYQGRQRGITPNKRGNNLFTVTFQVRFQVLNSKGKKINASVTMKKKNVRIKTK